MPPEARPSRWPAKLKANRDEPFSDQAMAFAVAHLQRHGATPGNRSTMPVNGPIRPHDRPRGVEPRAPADHPQGRHLCAHEGPSDGRRQCVGPHMKLPFFPQPKPSKAARVKDRGTEQREDEKQLAAMRATCFARDKGKCRCCGKKVERTLTVGPRQAQCHHITDGLRKRSATTSEMI
jgi:hypothetical protein